MPTLAPQNFPAGSWNFPAGTRRWYRLDMLVSEGGSAPVNVTLHAAMLSPTGVAITQIAWRYPGAPYSYQFAGDLVIPVSSGGTLVSLFVELITPPGTAPGIPQSATVTITGTSLASLPGVAAAVFAGFVGAPLDMRASISIVMDQTLHDASIAQIEAAKTAAKNLVGFMRAEDWANVYYLAPGLDPALPSELEMLRPMTAYNKGRMVIAIDGTPSSAVAPVRADLGINVPAKSLYMTSYSCACAPPKRTVLLLSGSAAMGVDPVKALPNVNRYAAWLGGAPPTPPGGYYSAFTIDDPASATGGFQLTKLLMQSLSMSSGSNVLLDPQGTLKRGQSVEIPFDVNDADSDMRVIALTDRPDRLKLSVYAEDEKVIPGRSRGALRRKASGFVEVSVARPEISGDKHSSGCGCGSGEAEQKPKPDELPPPKSGKWKAVLSLAGTKGDDDDQDGDETEAVSYALVVVANSRVNFVASVNQDSERIGASAFISARLEDSGVPISGDRARVFAEVTYPDGGTTTIGVPEMAEGRFEARVTLTQPGTTTFRIMTAGKRLPKGRFQRELTFTTLTQGFASCAPKCHHHQRGPEKAEPGATGQAGFVRRGPDDDAPADSYASGAKPEVGSRRRSLAERVLSAVAQEVLR